METSIDGWIDKEDMRYTHTEHNETLLSHKKEENFTIGNKDGPWGFYAKLK